MLYRYNLTDVYRYLKSVSVGSDIKTILDLTVMVSLSSEDLRALRDLIYDFEERFIQNDTIMLNMQTDLIITILRDTYNELNYIVENIYKNNIIVNHLINYYKNDKCELILFGKEKI